MKNFIIILSTLFLTCMASEARVVKGKVTSGKKKLSGVVVTDGQNFTQTRRNGTFSFEICDSAEFVYIVTPSGYIADWSEGWSTPEWYENGAKVADMTFTPGIDPAYLEIFNTVTNKTTRNYCTPLDKAILFTVNPTPGVTSGEIRVTDMFGNVYKETVSW